MMLACDLQSSLQCLTSCLHTALLHSKGQNVCLAMCLVRQLIQAAAALSCCTLLGLHDAGAVPVLYVSTLINWSFAVM